MQYKQLTSWLITVNILILLVLPQLNWLHYDPLPEFWAETTFAWAAVSLFLIVCFSFSHLNIPRIVIPLILLAIFLSSQHYLVNIDFNGLSYVTCFELFICILLAITTSTIIQEIGLKNTISILASSLIIGALLQSAIGLIQYTGLYKYLGNYIFYDGAHPTTNIFGHFGQRNHYCHYLSWGIFSLIYLFHQRKIKLPIFLLISSWLIFSMTIAASRSVFMYFGLASLISGVFYLYNRNPEFKKLFYLILITSVTLVGIEYLYPLFSNLFIHHTHINSGLQRIGGDGGLAGRRLIEWEKAWIVFKTSPLFGYGWNEYAKQSIYLQPLFPNAPLNDGLFTNCHNLILQMLAETGLIGTFIVVIGICYSIYAIIKRSNPESVIILCMLFTTLAHSMVEYPLWYIYFLGPFIMFLAIDKPLIKLSSNLIAGITFIPLSYMVYLMFNGSFIFNALVNYVDPPTEAQYFTSQAKYLEDLTNNNVFWAYPALYSLDNYITVNNKNTNTLFSTQTQLKYENQFSYFHPYPDNMIKQAMLNWNLGNLDKARQLVKLALVSFPVYKDSYLSSLKDKKYTELYQIAKEYQYKSN